MGLMLFSQQGLTPDYSIKPTPTSVQSSRRRGIQQPKVSYKNRTEAVAQPFSEPAVCLRATGLRPGPTER
ncbi:MAG: hypothetical protein ACLR8Y_15900 [Alistipes indistinctus]